MAKAAGLDPEQFPEDAEISPDLLEALASQKLTPDDIAIYHDEETGRPVIKSRQEIAQALGGVSEGHIYMVPNGKGQPLCCLFVMLFGRPLLKGYICIVPNGKGQSTCCLYVLLFGRDCSS